MKYGLIFLIMVAAICFIIGIAVLADVRGDRNSQGYHYSAERLNPGTILITNNEEYSLQGLDSINVTTSPNPVGDCIIAATSDSMLIPDSHVCNMHPFFVYDPSRKGRSAWIFGENNTAYADTTEITMTANYINGTSRVIHRFII